MSGDPRPDGVEGAGPGDVGEAGTGDVGEVGPGDVEEGGPRAMQLVARVERSSPPSTTAVAEAAAMSVVRLLGDPRAGPGGQWNERVERWRAERIRKLVRRARGAAWRRAAALEDGVTVTHRGAEVRAFVPGPVAQAPPELSRLQVSGMVLDDPDRVGWEEPAAGWPGVVIALNPGLDLSPGKQAAQSAHAAQLACDAMGERRREAWQHAGSDVRVVHPSPADWEHLCAVAPVAVHDGGFTEVPAGTLTAVAVWPAAVAAAGGGGA